MMKRFLSLWTIVATLASAHAATSSATRPNFLFIYTDDQRYDAMGVVQREQNASARFPMERKRHVARAIDISGPSIC